MDAVCSQVVQAPDASPAPGSLSAGKASALPGHSRLVRSLMQVSGTGLRVWCICRTMSKLLLWYSAYGQHCHKAPFWQPWNQAMTCTSLCCATAAGHKPTSFLLLLHCCVNLVSGLVSQL